MSRACETDLHANSRAGILPQYFQTIESESVFVERTHSLLFFFLICHFQDRKNSKPMQTFEKEERKGKKERKKDPFHARGKLTAQPPCGESSQPPVPVTNDSFDN